MTNWPRHLQHYNPEVSQLNLPIPHIWKLPPTQCINTHHRHPSIRPEPSPHQGTIRARQGYIWLVNLRQLPHSLFPDLVLGTSKFAW